MRVAVRAVRAAGGGGRGAEGRDVPARRSVRLGAGSGRRTQAAGAARERSAVDRVDTVPRVGERAAMYPVTLEGEGPTVHLLLSSRKSRA